MDAEYKNQKLNRKRVAINFSPQNPDDAALLAFLERGEVKDGVKVNFVRCLFLLGINAGQRGL